MKASLQIQMILKSYQSILEYAKKNHINELYISMPENEDR